MSNTVYNFDSCPDRTGTGSLKWDRYTGKSVLPLWVADMDFVSAPEILRALHERVDHGVMGYTIPYSDVEDAVIRYLQNTHHYTIEREWLVWTHGLVPALNVFCRAFGNPGDEILTCTPVYPPFLSAPGWQDKQCVTSHLILKDGRWTFDWEDLESKVTSKTRAFILCNPHNPVGRVYTPEELQMVADFCQRHNLVLCSDEIHCDLLFSGYKHTVTASLSREIEARTITLMAPSKTYNIPGLSCSFAIIANPELRAAFRKALRGFVTEVNAMGYAACAAAYREGEPWRQALMRYLEANRDFLYDYARSHWPAITLHPMEATYLAWLDVSELRKRGVENPHAFFEKNGVGLSPGRDFGDPNYLRLNFGCPRRLLEEALERMTKAMREVM